MHAAAAALVVGLSGVVIHLAYGHIWSPLSVPHYRAIQPLGLEQYYAALDTRRPASQVSKLLTSDAPEVVRRVLHYLSGWVFPWPHSRRGLPDRWVPDAPSERGTVHRDQAEAVKAAMGAMPDKVRPLAVGVYADLAGAEDIEFLRASLDDRDTLVRGVAAGWLMRRKDAASIPRMRGVSADLPGAALVDDVCPACEVVEAMEHWGDEGLAPALIQFLGNGKLVRERGSHPGISAIMARDALHAVTGHWFPFSVEESEDAWSQVESIPDKAARQRELQRILPGLRYPLRAELVGTPRPHPNGPYGRHPGGDFAVTVRVTNASTRTQVVALYPRYIDLVSPSIGDCHDPIRPDERAAVEPYATLEPGRWTEFDVPLAILFLVDEPSTRKLEFVYRAGRTHSDEPIPSWIGRLPVEVGPLLKEDPRPRRSRSAGPTVISRPLARRYTDGRVASGATSTRRAS